MEYLVFPHESYSDNCTFNYVNLYFKKLPQEHIARTTMEPVYNGHLGANQKCPNYWFSRSVYMIKHHLGP